MRGSFVMLKAMQSLKEFYTKNERHISSGALLFGFIIDNLTLTRIDLLLSNLILFSYLFTASISIIFINAYKNESLKGWVADKIAFVAPLLLQFAFGGLFSGFIIFYSRSGTLSTSWLFIVILAVLLIGNEFFKKQYIRLVFQVNILFIALFLFLIFYVPVIVGKMGAWIFLLSGVLSFLGIWLFVQLLKNITPFFVKRSNSFIRIGIISTFIFINILYFTNIIPPIPLSLKDAGIYHKVERIDGNYFAEEEKKTWYEIFIKRNTINIAIGKPIYFYSAVFAPIKLDTKIFHRWEYFDTKKNIWIETDRISFNIFGGRDGGYRGYSIKNNIREGLWRVDVMTNRGQILGRTEFRVKNNANSGLDLKSLQ